ncbi:FG-GAP repeat protein [Streptomyces hirsutus]|uniref:FG-GAP repeat protein n=1 Tax=Streptomyces hirsutus TaxID=35620 RepID=UPI00364390B6
MAAQARRQGPARPRHRGREAEPAAGRGDTRRDPRLGLTRAPAGPDRTPEDGSRTALPSSLVFPFPRNLAPGDLNGDGYDATVVGHVSTSEAYRKGGVLGVLSASATGPDARSRRTIDQNTPGVPGSVEAGDEFGNSLAMGDADGDGCTDLVVGTPGEDMGAERNADTELRRPRPTRGTAERLRAAGPSPRCTLRHRRDALLTNASGTVSPTPCPAPNGPAARCAGSLAASSPPVLSDLGSGCRTLTYEAPGKQGAGAMCRFDVSDGMSIQCANNGGGVFRGPGP